MIPGPNNTTYTKTNHFLVYYNDDDILKDPKANFTVTDKFDKFHEVDKSFSKINNLPPIGVLNVSDPLNPK
jgi:hypothetical protein